MKFKKIVCVDNIKLQASALEDLHEYSEEVDVYNDYPETNEEIVQRIKDADAVLVSWHTKLDEEIIKQCPSLKYIGMACSLYDDASANVAVNFARRKGITVRGIFDYGDPGVAEFIISKLTDLLHGFGESQWRDVPEEISGKKIGIIGLGTTGQLLAKCLFPFGADLFYYSRTRKTEWEERGVEYLPLELLLKRSEIISFHLPKNTVLLNEAEFKTFGNGKILINTSLGLPFEENGFKQWIQQEGNFAIFDGDGKSGLSGEVENFQNVIFTNKSAGWTRQTEKRLSQKVLQNLKDFLKK